MFELLAFFYKGESEKLKMKQSTFYQPAAPVYSFAFNPALTSRLFISLSLTHLTKVDTLTPSAGAVHFPYGAKTPHTPTASISGSHVALCGPLQMPWTAPPRQFSLKKWLMPVYFRKAKPFPFLGDGDCWKAKRMGKKEEIRVDWTDIWIVDYKMCHYSLALER